jgi:hypothetical protein
MRESLSPSGDPAFVPLFGRAPVVPYAIAHVNSALAVMETVKDLFCAVRPSATNPLLLLTIASATVLAHFLQPIVPRSALRSTC